MDLEETHTHGSCIGVVSDIADIDRYSSIAGDTEDRTVELAVEGAIFTARIMF